MRQDAEPDPVKEPKEQWVMLYSKTDLNVRNLPGADSGVIGQLQEGEAVYVSSVENGWARIQYLSGIAYVSADFLSDTEIPTTAAVIIRPVPETAPQKEPIARNTDPVPTQTHVGYVWITQNSKRYHLDERCSNMENPILVPVEEAIAMGKTECMRCYR
ncbi:MAG: SH3 domain-containing protein [Lachnospiraceae bacterium]|nr:SH3 domain-containing protein [Lachnospiraceae bacterium]